MLANPRKERKISRIHLQSSSLSFALNVSSSISPKEHEFLKKDQFELSTIPSLPHFTLASYISECSQFVTLEIMKQIFLKWKARLAGLSGSHD